MSQVIPEKYRDLFQKRAFASLGTLMPDGRPQVTPVWCDFDGEHVIFNSAKGRQKDRNVRRDPRVSLAIIDPDNPYRYVEIRGRVVEITEDGADDNINKLAKKYLGVDKYPYAQPSETRVIYKIKPEHTTTMGQPVRRPPFPAITFACSASATSTGRSCVCLSIASRNFAPAALRGGLPASPRDA